MTTSFPSIPRDSLIGRMFEDSLERRYTLLEGDWLDDEGFDRDAEQDEELAEDILRSAEVLELFVDAARV